MRKILSLITIIIILTLGLLLFTNCKPQISEDTTKEEASSSLKPEATVVEDKKIAEEETVKEDKGQDSENTINPDNKNEDEIPYANDFTLLDLDKNEVSLSDYKGKIVLINFWATWCPPCRLEIPGFIEVNNLYKDKNVQFIGVSVDTDIKALKDFVEDYGINYPTLIDGTIDNISPVWGIRAIPTTFILNENGIVMFRNVGMMTKDQLIKVLEGLL